MKMLMVSNGNFAEELYTSMKTFYSNPDIDYIGLKHAATPNYITKLQHYFKKYTEDLLILCDVYGSTAFNEAAILINKLHQNNKVAIICGMNLPMVFKLYGIKDTWDIESIKSFYSDSEKNGVIVYSPTNIIDA